MGFFRPVHYKWHTADSLFYPVHSTGYKSCSDGILTAGEECDDGNLIANDGCDANCKLESEALFLCVNVTTFGPTECCPAKINPVTKQRVCNCKAQASDNPGYTISEDCRCEY